MPSSVKDLMAQSGRSSSGKLGGGHDEPLSPSAAGVTGTTMSPLGVATTMSLRSDWGDESDPYHFGEAASSRSGSRLGGPEDSVVVAASLSVPTSPGGGRRCSIRHLEHAMDGLHLDSEFEEICRNTVAVQRGGLVASTLMGNRGPGNDHVIGGESRVQTTPERLLNFFAGEGAVYSQYDFLRQEFSGGPLPEPWKAVRSKTTGKIYYYNKETQETRWDPPLYPLSKDWKVETSPQSGATFYVHRTTGKWQWERPVDELFLDFQKSGYSDAKALEMWKERNQRADMGLAGLEELPSAQRQLEALPGPRTAEEMHLLALKEAGL